MTTCGNLAGKLFIARVRTVTARPDSSALTGTGAILLVVLAVAIGCGKSPTNPTSLAPESGVTDGDLAFCLSETNRYRAMAGVSAVTRSAAIESHAAAAAQSDARSGVAHGYSHTYATGAWGENEVLRQSTASFGSTPRSVIERGIYAFWSEGPSGPHHRILVDSSNTQVGCGLVINGGLVTFVQHFRR